MGGLVPSTTGRAAEVAEALELTFNLFPRLAERRMQLARTLSGGDLLHAVRALKEMGLAVILAEQNIPLALDLADRAVVLHLGRIVLEGEAKDLQQRSELRNIYRESEQRRAMSNTGTTRETPSALPLYDYAMDWEAFYAKYPPPDVFLDTVYRWPRERIRALQNERFLEVIQVGWQNPFYRNLWGKAGIKPSDIQGLNDIAKLPIFNSDDLKNDQQDHAPWGLLPGMESPQRSLTTTPIKLQTSGGTTGKPRLTLHGPIEWEINALNTARSLYL